MYNLSKLKIFYVVTIFNTIFNHNFIGDTYFNVRITLSGQYCFKVVSSYQKHEWFVIILYLNLKIISTYNTEGKGLVFVEI